MYCYFAYGMGIRSEIPLPALSGTAQAPDVTICRGDNRAYLPASPSESGWIRLTAGEAVLHLVNIGTIVVRQGKQVVVDMDATVDPGLIRQCLLGTVMGVLLGQRGKLVLHASSVAIDHRAVAFLGRSGLGKSSLAAALLARGHELVADDVTAVDFSPDIFIVSAGVSFMKIARDVAGSLGFEQKQLVTLWSGEQKAGLEIREPGSNEAIRLEHIFILEEGDNERIVSLGPAEATFDLIVNSYPTCLPEESDVLRMFQCGMLARNSKVYRLTRTADLTALPKLAEAVERYMHLA